MGILVANRSAWRRFWDDRAPGNGSAVVEFAIAFPLQLFIVFGLFQFILIAIATLMVNQAAQAGARAAIVGEDPARAALVVLSPLGGYADPETQNAQLAGPLEIPGWGELAHSRLAAEKIHVRLNDWPDPLPPRASPQTLADPTAYDDASRYTDTAQAVRRDLAQAFGDRDSATVVVEFDYELLFPLVDHLYALFYRPRAADGRADRTVTAFGQQDDLYRPDAQHYEWAWNPGEGYRDGVARIRTLGGRNHLVIARECTMYRGFPLD